MDEPCRVCGGHEREQRGKGVRCFGFLSDDSQWAHCTREELSGGIAQNQSSSTYAHHLSGPCKCGVTHGSEPAGTNSAGDARGAGIDWKRGATNIYVYADETGSPLFEVGRFRTHNGDKTFLQRLPGGADWRGGIGDTRRVLYRLRELLEGVAAGDEAWVAEGERDADALHAAGVVATTNPGGALKWSDDYSQLLRDADVVIVQDRDEKGRAHARQVAASLHRVARSVRMVEAKAGKDPSDHLDAGHGVEDFVPVELEAPEAESTAVSDDGEEDGEAEASDALTFPASALRGSFARFSAYLEPVTGASTPHVFASWWAMLASSIGSRRWGTWSGRVVPAVYVVNIGPTGDHKSTADERAIELLPGDVVLVDGITSDAGMFDTLADSADKPALLHFDELAFLLKMAGLSGSTLDSMLNRLWSAPEFLDRNLSRRKDGQGARRLTRPCVSLLAGSHVETFWRSLADPVLAIGSGFVNRLAVFVVERARSLPLTAEPDANLGAQLREHLASLARLEPARVDLSASAVPIWRQLARDHERQVARLPLDLASITKRVRDHVARLALVYATDAGRLTVEPADLAAAVDVGAFVQASYRRLLEARQPERGPARAASLERTVRRLLHRYPAAPQSVRNLVRSWPTSDRPSSAELRRALDSMDGVIAEAPSHGSRGKPRYRLEGGGSPTSRRATSRNDRASDVGLSGSAGERRA